MAATIQKRHLTENELSELSTSAIQLAAENKITQKNSWLLPLIDYMEDVVARQFSGDKNNFTVASCTLDASVKIWSNRVDSVHGSVYQVLGGLSRSDKSPSNDENEEEQEEGDEKENGTTAAPKRAAKKHASTIEQHPENLLTRKIESDFDVDPLFRKMSAKFDEGGAKGMLLNQLSLGSGCRLIFDASDSFSGNTFCSLPAMAPVIKSDVAAPAFAPAPMVAADDSVATVASAVNEKITSSTTEDASTGFIAGDDYDDLPAPGADDEETALMNELQDMSDSDNEAISDEHLPRPRASLPMTPRTPQTPAKAAAAAVLDSFGGLQLTLDADNEYGWFKADKLQAWAGPDHWKFRRAPKKADEKTAEVEDEDDEEKPTKGRKKKAFVLDFTATVDATVLLKKSRKAKNQAAPAEDLVLLLPEDVHFQPSSLRRLFHRQRFMLTEEEAIAAETQVESNSHVNDFDAGFENDDESDNEGFMPGGDYDDIPAVGGVDFTEEMAVAAVEPAVPESVVPSSEGTLTLVAAPKKVEKIQIGYAKTAKKVDVHALKNGLWGQLQTLTEKAKKPTTFQALVKQAPKAMPKEDMGDVSTAYCFICLLHLANEHGLKLEGNEKMDNLIITSSV